jgi:2-C-methyl-D-erythritol 4-phosphate cytidylyltransferase/2-C-methyl-D-erythritol 2,4-cyclodiphosphate synthase
VHAFTAGDHVMLCGVRIAHDKALAGHSDADVALHALTDALFGALGDGDIGTHFPPSEAQWKGAASDIFLKKAVDQVAGLGGRLVNVDITIIGEEPKIKPHRDALEANLSSLLGLHRSRVSVKATTTERLGFPGRQEGLAALAVCSVLLPATEQADAD